MRRKRTAVAFALAIATAGSSWVRASPDASPATRLVVVGDAIPQALTSTPGDPDRGRAIAADRRVGLCLLCHTGPFPEERFQGNLAPDLTGAGDRWSEGQLRLRLVDPKRFNPQTIMPSYHHLDGGARIGPAWQGKPVLAAQQIEDVIAFLVTLRR